MSVRDRDDRRSHDLLRDARGDDLDAVRRLLAEAGLPVAGVEEQLLKVFRVAERGGGLTAVAGCEIHGTVGLLPSLAVREERRGARLARRLVEDRLAWARRRGLRAVYLLTTNATAYFERLGFVPVERSETPAEIRASSEFATVCPDSAIVMTLPLARRTPGNRQLEQRRQALRFRALHDGPPILVGP